MNDKNLPKSVQEIADVIGRERALFLIGQLPRYYNATNQSSRVCLYVPTQSRMPANHPLALLMGWHDAAKLSQHFGGEILNLPNCAFIHQNFRQQAMARLVGEGVPVPMIAEWFKVSERTVKNLLKEKPQELLPAANDDNYGNTTEGVKA